METIRTIANEYITMRQRLGLTINIPSTEQLNYKYKILTNRPLINSNAYPSVKLFGVGIGGDVLGSVRNPNQRSLTLNNLIPIRVNDKRDIFERSEDRSDYRLRVAVNSDRVIVPLSSSDITHYIYFLKTLKNTNNGPVTTKTVLEENDDIFEYDIANIKKYLTGISDGIESSLKYYNPNDSEEKNIITKTELKLNISKIDADSVINYFNDDKFNFISEVGIFTSIDDEIVDNQITYKESYAVQLAYHSTFLSQNFKGSNIKYTIV